MQYETPSGHVVVLDDDVALPGRLSVGSHGYAQLTGVRSGSVVLLHRWLLGILDAGPRVLGDHVNRDRLDNQRHNLRVVTPSESSANVRGRAGSGYRGVYPANRGGGWSARAKYRGKIHNLGTYPTPEEAAEVSAAWRRENLPGYVERAA